MVCGRLVESGKMKEKIKVVIVGNIAFDVNTFTGRNNGKDKVVVNKGGAGYYSLIPSSLFTRTGIVARVGNDFDMSTLKSTNVDLTGLKKIMTSSTTKFHHTYMSDDGQTRTFRPEVYEETLITPEDFPEEYYEAEYIHIATNFPYMQKQFIDMIRKRSKAIISIDTHEAYMEQEADFIKEIFDSVDIAFIDKEYAQLLDCKAPIRIIKMGKSGCRYEYKNKVFTVETEEKPVVDKTGAGDVIAGVFLAMMSTTQNPVQSLKTAVSVATKSIGSYGVDFLADRQIQR